MLTIFHLTLLRSNDIMILDQSKPWNKLIGSVFSLSEGTVNTASLFAFWFCFFIAAVRGFFICLNMSNRSDLPDRTHILKSMFKMYPNSTGFQWFFTVLSVHFYPTKKTPESLRQPSNVLICKASRAFSEFQFFTDKAFLTFCLQTSQDCYNDLFR